MSITLVTGVPGSGKTLYTIDKLLRPLVGATSDKIHDNGTVQKIPRVIYSNINGLLLDHELIDGGDNQGLRDWHKWAKPGSIIVFDEFQKFWPPRPNGAKIPDDLQALDTHRHMGVDFILVTQNCMNVDRHIIGLVDRHLHIRRVANMPMAVVYEWDHASKALLYKNSLTKAPWRYDKSVFKLYKSAELHTKQKRRIPGLVWFILIGIGGFAYAAPTLKARFETRVQGTSPAAAASPALPSSAVKPGDSIKTEYVKDGIRYQVETVHGAPPDLVPPIPASSAPMAIEKPEIAGCILGSKRCRCVDGQGREVPTEPAQCVSLSGLSDVPKIVLVDDAPLKWEPSEADSLAFAFNANGRKPTGPQFSQ